MWGLGAHVIKVGLAPVLIDLMERGYVTAIALNGAGIIHDFELAVSGKTSEDVEAALQTGLVQRYALGAVLGIVVFIVAYYNGLLQF